MTNKDYNFKPNMAVEHIVEHIRNWFSENGNTCNAVIGMSGGKDSTIAAALLVKALGKDRVIGVAMPDEGQNDNDAKEICEYLGIQYICIPIATITKEFNSSGDWSYLAEQNIPPRVRMTMLYAIAQSVNGRVINTCNLSEDYIGYSTLYGDSAGSYSVFRHFTCNEVIKMGDCLGLPMTWTYKTPDDGLPHSKPDEEKFGFTYDELDYYIRSLNTYKDDPNITKTFINKIKKIEEMHEKNLFKIQLINIPSYKPDFDILYGNYVVRSLKAIPN